MGLNDPREALERLIRDHGASYAALSRLLGRNSAYIQQFIKRGTPGRLEEQDRQLLARYFGVDESVLGGRAEGGRSDMVLVPKLDVRASAGQGALVDGEAMIGHFGFDPRWLRRLSAAKSGDLSIIQVMGDSMAPTLVDGDDVLVDRSDGVARLRDGIYVLRRDEVVMVKRLALHPAASAVTIASDNPTYPTWDNCGLDTIEIVGRVVWAGRRFG